LPLRIQLAAHLHQLHIDKLLAPAGVGNIQKLQNNQAVRKDFIYWLDREHQDEFENQFFDLMDAFVLYLNETCYTGILNYEFHYTRYETGTFYKKHLDQFRSNKGRAFSMIMYLNAEWAPEDGGELCIFHDGHTQTIAPLNGTCVFFKSSELEHEVLLTHAPRMSITGWLKTD
jgi:SM-20-related protein